jgi:integrase
MTPEEETRFAVLYGRHERALKLQGYAKRTIDSYARAVRRLSAHFDGVPDRLSVEQLEEYFAGLVDSHSWATVKVDRNGLQFFWKHVLKQDWNWLEIIKPPKVRTLPDILTVPEVERLIGCARKLRYRVFVLTTYSMGLRLSETLSLTVADIDRARGQVHIRRGKGHKDRFVPLPDLAYQGLRTLWAKHRNPRLLFPNASGSPEKIRRATSHMDPGGAQKALRMMLADCGIKKRSPCTRCATVSPPTCTSKGWAYGIFRPFSVIAAPPRPHCTLS